MKRICLCAYLLLVSVWCFGENSRWQITPRGSIVWEVKKSQGKNIPTIPHYDHIEMSGDQVSAVLRYGVNADGSFRLERSMVWPLLRTIPNDTHASLMRRFSADIPSLLIVNGRTLQQEQVKQVALDGTLTVTSEYSTEYPSRKETNPSRPIEVTRILFPSTELPMLCEEYVIKNKGNQDVSLLVPEYRSVYHTEASKGVDGSYTLVHQLYNPGTFLVKPGDSIVVTAAVQAHRLNESDVVPDVRVEKQKRDDFVAQMWSNLVVETPDPVLNTAFAFAKIRGSESIYKTRGGYMHGPGGESYYAAIWANDQAEYIGPFFPYLGYEKGNASSLNAYLHFARFMNDDFKPIPSSIIAEGLDIWNGAGDRGDGAMIAYGAARYALVRGDKTEAEQLWPLITWCLEYCRQKLNDAGVVTSNCDELEGRFPAGDANLCTSSLYYDALLSAAYLGKSLGKPSSELNRYRKQAKELKSAIENYFGAKVEGFDTYQYYDGNDVLRSWICIPLTVGIYDRAQGTIDALFSPRLWTRDGLLTQAGSETFWDRSTLYALRGVFAAGETEKALEYLKYYSTTRLLGEHVPYPIEAWPEGNQRHLSAESGLYCRIYTEGLFGIRPTGFRSFDLLPRLPQEWDTMALRRINGFGKTFDIEVTRQQNGKLEITLWQDGKVIQRKSAKNGQQLSFSLK